MDLPVKSCLVAMVMLAAVASAGAQNPSPQSGTVTGQVTERVSGQPVAGAVIAIADRTEAVTDEEGRYRLELPPGTWAARVKARGYAPLIIGLITVTARYTSIYDVRLDLQVSEEMTVSSGYYVQTTDQPISNVTLRRAELRSLPGTGGDALRAISSLPGVTADSAQFGDLLVRGGFPSENLTFIDNIPIGDFTYFSDQYDNGRGGRAALLAPDVFDRLEFSAGGFGARYGDRMSSALDITIRKATRDRVQGSLFADSGVAGGSVEIPLGPRAGWFVSIRRSYIDLAFELFDLGDIGKPRNLDVINKIDVDLAPRHKLSLTAMTFAERITVPFETAQRASRRDQLISERTGKRYIAGATLSSTLGDRTLSNITAWGIGEHNDGSFLRIDRTTLQRRRDLRESQFGIKQELTTAFSPRVNLAAGGALIVQQGDIYTFERSPVGYSPIGEEYRAPTREHHLRIDSTVNGYAYAQATWQATSRLSISPGVRFDRYGVTRQTLISPRASARIRLSSRFALNLAAGLYRQPPPSFLLALTPENRTLKAQRSVHAIGGIEWLAREDVRVTVEAYRKSYYDLLVQPTRTSPRYLNTGEADVQGVEVTAQKALSGRFAGQAGYSWTRARRRFTPEGFTFPSEVARPHQLTLIGLTRIKLWGQWLLASKMRVASGLAYSNLTPVIFNEPPRVTLFELLRPEDRNALRLPNFFQLDLRVERRFDFRRWSFSPYVDIFNLTKYTNVVDVNYRLGSGTAGFLRERTLIPIIGGRIEF
ncbi:MAG: TonB-dependent receptor [Acidobacteria bacterium]|nr:TonB-dependent receptor [Acidobacteriota bacterium]